jgi:CubicO group peptidase (beta-lactamase class C family)
MAARVAKGELPGMVTLVAAGDDVHVDVIGTMAFGGDEPMRRDTIFRIASLTKPILATATMMLVEDGTLALNEPIDRLLPELANRRVLRHIDGPLDDTVVASRPITVEDLLSFRMGHGLLIEPTFDPPFRSCGQPMSSSSSWGHRTREPRTIRTSGSSASRRCR